METNKRIIVVIGKRRSGKTTVAEILRSSLQDASHLTMLAFGLQAYVQLHEITVSDFWKFPDHHEHRVLLGAFLDHARTKDKQQFIEPFLTYIDKLQTVIIEDVFYFNELESLLIFNPMIILVHAEESKRVDRNFGKKFTYNDPLEGEVGSISADMVKHWKNTYIVKNDKDIPTLKEQLRRLV